MSIRGYCSQCHLYELVADKHGVVSCSKCGANDLVPTQDAIEARRRGVKAFDRWARQHRRAVKRGLA